jgi:cell division protein ZipA
MITGANPGIGQLRLILLVVGLLFIVALVWLERRGSRQDRGKEREAAPRPERSEPVLDLPEHANVPTLQPLASSRGPDPGRALPVIDWSTATQAATAAAPGWHDPTGDAPADAGVDPAFDADLPPARRAADPGNAPPALVVDWPAENLRHIVSLRIVASRQDRLSGRALRQALTGSGFRHGQFGIFHLPAADGRVVLSAASLVRPGMLDPENMDFQRFAGVNLFAVLPGPLSTQRTLDQLASVATGLATRIEGRVQDENGGPFDTGNLNPWRERCQGALPGGPAGATEHAD